MERLDLRLTNNFFCFFFFFAQITHSPQEIDSQITDYKVISKGGTEYLCRATNATKKTIYQTIELLNIIFPKPCHLK